MWPYHPGTSGRRLPTAFQVQGLKKPYCMWSGSRSKATSPVKITRHLRTNVTQAQRPGFGCGWWGRTCYPPAPAGARLGCDPTLDSACRYTGRTPAPPRVLTLTDRPVGGGNALCRRPQSCRRHNHTQHELGERTFSHMMLSHIRSALLGSSNACVAKTRSGGPRQKAGCDVFAQPTNLSRLHDVGTSMGYLDCPAELHGPQGVPLPRARTCTLAPSRTASLRERATSSPPSPSPSPCTARLHEFPSTAATPRPRASAHT
jgi:hypothetical protein